MANGLPLEDAVATASAVMLSNCADEMTVPRYRDLCGMGLSQISRVYLGSNEEHEIDHAGAANPIVRLSALHRINRAATANLQLGEMLETTVRVVAETTGSDDCAVFLYDAATDTLALKAAIGLEPSAIGALTIRPGTGITGRAAAEGQPIIAPESAKHPSHLAIPGVGDDRYTSQASIPMMIRGANRLVGVLAIEKSLVEDERHRIRRRPFRRALQDLRDRVLRGETDDLQIIPPFRESAGLLGINADMIITHVRGGGRYRRSGGGQSRWRWRRLRHRVRTLRLQRVRLYPHGVGRARQRLSEAQAEFLHRTQQLQMRGGTGCDGTISVSYTHLTLPTSDLV